MKGLAELRTCCCAQFKCLQPEIKTAKLRFLEDTLKKKEKKKQKTKHIAQVVQNPESIVRISTRMCLPSPVLVCSLWMLGEMRRARRHRPRQPPPHR